MTARPGRRRPGNLPVDLSSFVGRAGELSDAARLLAGARLLTVTGPAGVGKTRTALRLAGGLRRLFPDGVWRVELSGTGDPAAAVAATLGRHAPFPARDEAREAASSGPREARGSGARDAAPGTVWEAVTVAAATDAIAVTEDAVPGGPAPAGVAPAAPRPRDRRMLLVLDTCEHLLGEAARLAGSLMAGASGVTVVATSRRPLGLPGERVLRLAPLPQADAVRLFEDRAVAADPGFTLTAAAAPVVAEICDRLDGLPLAVELAAARMRSMSAGDLLEELRHRFTLLGGVSRSVLPRHRDLRAAVQWSHRLCDAEQRRMWSMLGTLPGPFDLAAAERACAAALGADRVAPVLAELVESSVVLREPGDRYRMPKLYRRFGPEPPELTERPEHPAHPERPEHPAGHRARPSAPRQPRGVWRPVCGARQPARTGQAVAGTLSARELQVAELITEGLSNPQIAVRLGIAKRTVDAHVRNILAKGGLASRTQVAAWVAESDRQPPARASGDDTVR
ncbi:LuxR C-terminal-related transcriptional regulator [Streptosporangium sp. NPDC004379]|uniref:LuxR C-terminal-related transcriptional regulator n=1 Tax=Streptosporangium sp. NPDC004379 TaxID=3366189 RepID=UPI0036BD9F25